MVFSANIFVSADTVLLMTHLITAGARIKLLQKTGAHTFKMHFMASVDGEVQYPGTLGIDQRGTR